jgi:hypothetical protein
MSPAKANKAKRVSKIPTRELKRPSLFAGFLKIYKEAQKRMGAGQKASNPNHFTNSEEPKAPMAPM